MATENKVAEPVELKEGDNFRGLYVLVDVTTEDEKITSCVAGLDLMSEVLEEGQSWFPVVTVVIEVGAMLGVDGKLALFIVGGSVE